MTGMSGRLAAFLHEVAANPSDEVIASANARVQDTVGISVAALNAPSARAVSSFVETSGGAGESWALGVPSKVPAAHAALVNGTLAHALDFDDTHLPSILHPSATVIPAALAAADIANPSGRRLLGAIGAGIEMCIRLGMAGDEEGATNNAFFERGLHATSVCGTVASAATAAVVLGLSVEETTHAIGIATSMGSGIIEANRAGGSIKQIHCGWAAKSGVTAALLAQVGITGPDTALEGRFGFVNAFTQRHPLPDSWLDDLGSRWHSDDCFIKPYPANVFTHTGIDVALYLRQKGITPDAIELVELSVPTAVTRTISEPRHEKIAPQTGYHAKFSGPFTFAMALTRGAPQLGDFADTVVSDPQVLALASRVQYTESAAVNALYPFQLPTHATVLLKSGRTIEHRVDANQGTSHRRWSDGVRERKYKSTIRGLSQAAQDELTGRLGALASADGTSGLLAGIGARPDGSSSG